MPTRLAPRPPGSPCPAAPVAAPTAPNGRSVLRIVLADDHLLFVQMLQRLLERAAGCQVVGLATDGPTALALVARHRPDLLLLDLELPGLPSVEVARRVRTAYPDVAVLVLTGYPTIYQPRPLLELGVRGYLPKTASRAELLVAIDAVVQGRTVVVSATPPTAPGRPREAVTPREQEVLRLLAAGLRTRAIAARLSVSPRTVERHLTVLRGKLDARTPAELVRQAEAAGVLPPSAPTC
jgi:two-component system response regulator DesR